MAQKQVLSENFTDNTLPIIYDDAMQAAGTLALLDFGHSLGAFTGVPAEGAALPNIAWKTANNLVTGAPGQSALSLVYTTNTTNGEASTPIKERTPKKGLNIIYSQANDVSTKYNRVRLPQAIFDYVKANLGHSYYWSAWHRITRAGVTGTPYGAFMSMGRTTGLTLMAAQYSNNSIGAGFVPAQAAPQMLGSAATPGYNTVSNQLSQIAVAGNTGGDMSAWLLGESNLYQWGYGGPFSNLHIAHSGILYRLVFEDLTVSGRTYAQAKAIDDALWTTAFASGGKFNGDTYTDPAAYP